MILHQESLLGLIYSYLRAHHTHTHHFPNRTLKTLIYLHIFNQKILLEACLFHEGEEKGAQECL
jgi:hypothetical protein